jgi:hypothetical protein
MYQIIFCKILITFTTISYNCTIVDYDIIKTIQEKEIMWEYTRDSEGKENTRRIWDSV